MSYQRIRKEELVSTRLIPMPDYNLSLDLVRHHRGRRLGAARWVGRGEKNAADQAAVDAMRLFFNTVHMDGLVVIGEGEKDRAPMLFNGERIVRVTRRRSTSPWTR